MRQLGHSHAAYQDQHAGHGTPYHHTYLSGTQATGLTSHRMPGHLGRRPITNPTSLWWVMGSTSMQLQRDTFPLFKRKPPLPAHGGHTLGVMDAPAGAEKSALGTCGPWAFVASWAVPS